MPCFRLYAGARVAIARCTRSAPATPAGGPEKVRTALMLHRVTRAEGRQHVLVGCEGPRRCTPVMAVSLQPWATQNVGASSARDPTHDTQITLLLGVSNLLTQLGDRCTAAMPPKSSRPCSPQPHAHHGPR